jgi:anti-anti-sigma factor
LIRQASPGVLLSGTEVKNVGLRSSKLAGKIVTLGSGTGLEPTEHRSLCEVTRQPDSGTVPSGRMGGRHVMAGDYLKVRALRDGRVCVLTVTGELDLVSADRLLAVAGPAVAADYDRVVLDLAGLTFADCCGARVLAALARAVPGERPVTVRSVQPAVRRVLDLIEVSLERIPGEKPVTAEDRTAKLIRDMRFARSRAAVTMAEARTAAWLIAETRDSVAATMTVIAQRKPEEAERLLALSESARTQAERFRMLAAWP